MIYKNNHVHIPQYPQHPQMPPTSVSGFHNVCTPVISPVSVSGSIMLVCPIFIQKLKLF